MFCLLKQMPNAFEKPLFQFSLQCLIAGGDGLPGGGTAGAWPQQKLPSEASPVVTVVVELTYLCRFGLQQRVSPSFFEEVQQRGGCIQTGCRLTVLVCSACRATLLFQTQV